MDFRNEIFGKSYETNVSRRFEYILHGHERIRLVVVCTFSNTRSKGLFAENEAFEFAQESQTC